MFTVNLKAGLRFEKDNKIYQVLKLLPNNIVEVLDESFGDNIRFTQQELISSLTSGNLHFEAKGKNVRKTSNDHINTSYQFNDIASNKHKNKALYKFRVIQPLLDIYDRKESDINKRVNEINNLIENPKAAEDKLRCNYFQKVSRTSVYRWLKEYEEGNKDFRSLIPSYHNCGGKNTPRLSNIIIDFINQCINENYLQKQRLTKYDVYCFVVNKVGKYNELSIDNLPIPSLSTIVRYINKIPEFELVDKRYSNRNAIVKFGIIKEGVNVSYPLERVEIDTKTIDVLIIGEDGDLIGRPNFIAALDKFTRNILGFHISFGKTGWQDTMQCMRHIMTDKSYVKTKYPDIKNRWTAFGVPKTIISDNGSEFKNRFMEDACLQLGIVLEYAPPRVPEWKGSIERFFGTSDTSFTHNLPGTTRSNPQQLAEDEKPSRSACLTLSLFTKLIHKWIIDVYSQSLNKGANGIPSKIWDKFITKHPVAWPNSISELAVALGKIEYRQITNKGIQLNNIFYNSFDLHNLYLKFSKENKGLKEKFKIKYNPLDISSVFVYDHLFTKNWIEVPSLSLEYTSRLSEWEHSECCKRVRKELGTIDILSLSMAKVEIYNDIQEGIKYSRTRIAKTKKIDSSKDIFQDQNYDSSIDSKVTKNKILTSNSEIDVSNLGHEYEHSNQSNSIIISLQDVKKEKTNISNTNSQRQELNNANKLITEEELLDFEVINLGDDINE